MAKKSGTKSTATNVKDLPVKDGNTVKGGAHAGEIEIGSKR